MNQIFFGIMLLLFIIVWFTIMGLVELVERLYKISKKVFK